VGVESARASERPNPPRGLDALGRDMRSPDDVLDVRATPLLDVRPKPPCTGVRCMPWPDDDVLSRPPPEAGPDAGPPIPDLGLPLRYLVALPLVRSGASGRLPRQC
jgi:hypothetical protein